MNEIQETILNKLGELSTHEFNGQLRLGQMISLFVKPNEDLFYLEDKELLKRLEDFQGKFPCQVEED